MARGAVGDVDIPAERDRRLLQCRILADVVSRDPDELIVDASHERGRHGASTAANAISVRASLMGQRAQRKVMLW